MGFIRYEDFIKEPETEMRAISEKLRLHFDKTFIAKWSKFNKITGDIGKYSRGFMSKRIVSLPRFEIEKDLLKQFRKNKKYWEALAIVDYHDIED